MMGWRCALCAGLGAAAVLAARRALLVVVIDGVSMQPTFQPGETALAFRRSASSPVHRDEVVVCQLPAKVPGPNGYLVKRIVALPGDEVDGAGLVPAGHVFVRGDGIHSYDSRQFGSLPMSAVRGKVIARLSLSAHRP